MATISSRFVVPNLLGMHARPAALFVKRARRYEAEVRVKNGPALVDGKSIMDLLSIGATQGAILTVVVEGRDADAAMADLHALFASAFDES